MSQYKNRNFSPTRCPQTTLTQDRTTRCQPVVVCKGKGYITLHPVKYYTNDPCYWIGYTVLHKVHTFKTMTVLKPMKQKPGGDEVGGLCQINSETNMTAPTLDMLTISYFLSCGRQPRSETMYPTEHFSNITVTHYQVCLKHRITSSYLCETLMDPWNIICKLCTILCVCALFL